MQKITAMMLLVLLVSGWWLQRIAPKPAPDATFHTISGQTIELTALKGQPVIVTFWSTTCPSCIAEMPDLIALYRQFQPQGLHLIAVAMAGDPPSYVLAMAKAKQLPYAVALDMQGEVAHAFGDVALTPTTFLIAPDGQIVQSITGRFDLAAMQQQLQSWLSS